MLDELDALVRDNWRAAPDPDRSQRRRFLRMRGHRRAPARQPVSVYGVGEEPDPRFTLANERTALAWMRTGLALVGGGVALISLSSLAGLPRWSALIGAAACMGGGLLAVRAVTGWSRVERALRLKEALPAPRALVFLAGGVVVLACLTLVLAVLELLRA